ncbi:MAG: PEP-CTERM system histidine kinase PrsK [Gammaproteobacteria bacterium]|nr:PEP-CTERM system histidine kinase PrsK [Gammaproteobacteria bacterium]
MVELGVIGFAISALLYFGFALLLATSWKGRMRGGFLLLAVVITTVWSIVMAVQFGYRIIPQEVIWSVEAARNLSWLLFLYGLLDYMLKRRESSSGFYFKLLLLVSGLSFIRILPSSWFGDLFNLDVRLCGQLVIAVIGLVMVEQVFRNTALEHRWGIKYLSLGLGGMFVFDFYLFADALLFNRIDSQLWAARGAVNALIVPLFAVSTARNPDWSLDLFVSRRFVFHSSALITVGLYMIFMAVAGYYIKFYGGEWGSVLQVTFLFAAIGILIILLFSGQVRARGKVFLNKHFFSYRYDYREEWLRLNKLLSGENISISIKERVIWALAEIVDSGGGYLWQCNQENGCYFSARWNEPEPQEYSIKDIDHLLAFFEGKKWVIDIEEYKQSPDVYDDIDLSGWLFDQTTAWLIAPLIQDECISGFVVLTQPKVKLKVNWENLDLLKTAGMQAASYLALFDTANKLAEAKQFEGFNRLSAFVVHDLKNLVAQLSLVSTNAEKHKHNPEFIDDAIGTINNAVSKMSRLMGHLKDGADTKTHKAVDISEVLQTVVQEKSRATPIPILEIKQSDLLVNADADRMEAVIGHVIQNAQDATDEKGEVLVELRKENNCALVKIKDTGSGMEKKFIQERLFKPFDSTKGLTGMGIGAYECKEFVHSLGGDVTVFSKLGEGTCFIIRLPLANLG